MHIHNKSGARARNVGFKQLINVVKKAANAPYVVNIKQQRIHFQTNILGGL